MTRGPFALLSLTLIALALAADEAAAQRFAVVIGSNAGRPHEGTLEFAERDASRMADVLTSVGSVSPDQLVLVQGGTAASARQALIATNERIRDRAGADSILLVYYSGHSDAEALHLGSSNLPLAELEGLVRGSAARIRVLIVDSCRSGALTRGKGGRPAPAMQLRVMQPSGDGVVVLTASAAGEDAQESPALGGSFFTHHLISGLLGAADADGDGQVTISEAYDYAYANTLRDSSATIAGSQHPSYRYDIRGQGEVALTEVKPRGGRAQLVIPAGAAGTDGLDVLVMRGSASGAMLAEARTAAGSPGALSLPPGKMFIRVRTERALFEQEVTLRAGQTMQLETAKMDRIELARLARKGGTHVPFVAGVGASLAVRPGLADRDALCAGGSLYVSLVYRSLSLVPRLGACHERFSDARLESATTEVQLSFALNVHRDLSRRFSAYVGPELGVAYFRQSMTPLIGDPSRHHVVGGALTVQAGVERQLGGFTIGARALAQTYFLELQNPSRDAAAVSAVFAWGLSLGLTRYLR